MSDSIPVTREIADGIEAVRLSGLTNMLDRLRVSNLAEAFGFEVTAVWVRANGTLYNRGVFRGFEIQEKPDA